MSRLYYDLHLHSCLSPCGDNDSTPNDIAGMAKLLGLDIIALTDHNSMKNCPAFFAACERYGIISIAGMELTTAEDIHVVCLFPTLEDGMKFDKEIEKHRILVKNRKDIFGEQRILNEKDELTGEEDHLLTVATDISIEDAPGLVAAFGGVCYPAHIDREANGMISILGTFPTSPSFSAYELRDPVEKEEYEKRFSLSDKLCVVGSDAHCLENMRERENYFELCSLPEDTTQIAKRVIDLIRGGLK